MAFLVQSYLEHLVHQGSMQHTEFIATLVVVASIEASAIAKASIGTLFVAVQGSMAVQVDSFPSSEGLGTRPQLMQIAVASLVIEWSATEQVVVVCLGSPSSDTHEWVESVLATA